MTDNLKALSEAARATVVYSRELDITNADHIALWLDSSKPLDTSISWLACRIIEAHEIEVAKIHNIYRTGQLVPADAVKEAEARGFAQGVAYVERISDLIGEAVQADCENGVRWLNERAAAAYMKEYPATLAALRTIQDEVVPEALDAIERLEHKDQADG